MSSWSAQPSLASEATVITMHAVGVQSAVDTFSPVSTGPVASEAKLTSAGPCSLRVRKVRRTVYKIT